MRLEPPAPLQRGDVVDVGLPGWVVTDEGWDLARGVELEVPLAWELLDDATTGEPAVRQGWTAVAHQAPEPWPRVRVRRLRWQGREGVRELDRLNTALAEALMTAECEGAPRPCRTGQAFVEVELLDDAPALASRVLPDLTGEQDDALQQVAASTPGLELLVLHGSRARGEAHERSDWDLAYLGEDVDRWTLQADLSDAVRSDVDLADLSTAGAVLRRDVASHGCLMHETREGALLRYREQALLEWADLQPLLTQVHRQVLEEVAAGAARRP